MPPASTTHAPATVHGPATAPRSGWRGRWDRLREAPEIVRRLALATLVANVVIVLTGGAVRLTDSGLGCPEWPHCTEGSYHNTPAYGVHGYIEFGNRLLTFALSAVVGATIIAVLAQRARRTSLVTLALAQFGGVVAQAVIGGITVLTGLNPWTVGLHLLVSMGLIFGAYVLWRRAGEGDGATARSVALPLVWLARVIAVVTAVTLAVGTVVTGSGPHSGDSAAQRNGFDAESMSQLHTDVVFLLLGLSVAMCLAVYAVETTTRMRRAAVALLVVELAQGTVGLVQYFTGLPVVLVGAHLLGACLVWIMAVHLLFATRERAGQPQEPATECL